MAGPRRPNVLVRLTQPPVEGDWRAKATFFVVLGLIVIASGLGR